MADKSSIRGRVCVTGGTGFLGSWLVMRLLEHGYSVNTTIRVDPDNKRDISYLTNLPGASERLQLFNADLNNPESFAAAIQGCIGVFHTAHPLDVKQDEEEEEDVKIKRLTTAMQGILQACLDSKTVKQVVHTSTLGTACFTNSSQPIDESSWTDVDFVRKKIGSLYVVTKVSTEKLAADFAEKHGLDVVHVLPTWIGGPFICPALPATARVLLGLILGEEHNYRNLVSTSFVHVDDVARAHIHLFEHPDAKGRYLCTGVQFTIKELCELIAARFPEYKLPTAESLKDLVPLKLSGILSKKLVETGFRFENGLEEMLDGAIKSCKEKGLL